MRNISLNQRTVDDKPVDKSVTQTRLTKKRVLLAYAFPVICLIFGSILVLYGALTDNGVMIGSGWTFVTLGVIVIIMLLSRRCSVVKYLSY